MSKSMSKPINELTLEELAAENKRLAQLKKEATEYQAVISREVSRRSIEQSALKKLATLTPEEIESLGSKSSGLGALLETTKAKLAGNGEYKDPE